MRPKHLVAILLLLMLAVPVSPAHASGVVGVCDEAHLRAALAGGGMVTFACSGTITLTAEIVIVVDTTIDGSGQSVTISGNNAVRMFTVNEGVTLNVNRLTVVNGVVSGYPGGGGIYNDRGAVTVSNSTFLGNSAYNSQGGGGIYNDRGTVTVSNSTLTGNSAGLNDAGGGIRSYGGTVTVSDSTFSGNTGGGISTGYRGTLTVSNSTFSGNSAGSGGGIDNSYHGTVTVSNSTFSDNHADRAGGGIYNYWGAVTVTNSTFFGNSAGYHGGGISNDQEGTVTVSNSTFSANQATYGAGSGGGISNHEWGLTVTLNNTIVDSSPSGDNCGGTITDGGGNLSYPDTTCPGINADPMLGPLQNNGGPTETMALGPGSAAIDAGDDAICAAPPVNNLDQRGIARPQGAHCDIGAVEQIVEPAAVSVSALSAQSPPGAITPATIAGLLLAILVGVGVGWRGRPARSD